MSASGGKITRPDRPGAGPSGRRSATPRGRDRAPAGRRPAPAPDRNRTAPLDHVAGELGPRHPLQPTHLGRVGTSGTVDGPDVDGAQLVLDHAVQLGAVGEAGQHQSQVAGLDTELLGGPPRDGLPDRLAGCRVTAHRVGPQARERRLVRRPPCDEQRAVAAEEIGREGEVERRARVVDRGLRRDPDRLTRRVDENDLLSHPAALRSVSLPPTPTPYALGPCHPPGDSTVSPGRGPVALGSAASPPIEEES